MDLLQKIRQHKGKEVPEDQYPEVTEPMREFVKGSSSGRDFGPSRDQLPGGMTQEELERFSPYADWQPILPFPEKEKPKTRVAGNKTGSSSGVPEVVSDNASGGGFSDFDPEAVKEVALKGESGELPDHEQMAYEKAKKAIQSKESGINLKPLAALLDSWYGGNLAAVAPGPGVTEEDKEEALANLGMKYASRKTELAKERQDRLDKLKVNLERAKSEGAKGKLEHKIQMLQLKLAEEGVRRAKTSGRGGVAKTEEQNPAWVEFRTTSKQDIANYAKDHGMPVGEAMVSIRRAAQVAREEDPGLSQGESYALAYRTLKNRRGDVQKDDGGDNVGLFEKKQVVFPGRS